MTAEPRSNLWLRLLPAILVIVALGVFYWWQRGREQEQAAGQAVAAVEQAEAAAAIGSAFDPLEQAWVDATGAPPEWPGDFGQPAGCAEAVDRLRALMLMLDGRDYVQGWGLPAGSFGLLVESARSLGRQPPTLGFRLTDGNAVQTNVTYLVRVLGVKRVVRLAELAAREAELAEPLALALYQWLQAGDRCAADARPPATAVQYDYAAFLLQTIGGQAYLVRRSPRGEALASFYALLIADASIARGYDPQGLDLLPRILRCRALIETQPLVFRERYLAALNEMAARWEALGNP